MTNEIIAAWRKYGVAIEVDTAGYWSWCEVDDNGEDDGPFSPPFQTLEACVGDLVDCFGPLEAQ